MVDLTRDLLVALAAVAWADGTMAPEEAASLRSAADQLGLAANDRQMLESALRQRVQPADVETVRMKRETRLFVYAASLWIASVDGQISPEEEAVLGQLGDRLGLSSAVRQRARDAVLSMTTPGPREDKRFDLLALRALLSDGLRQIDQG